MRSSGWSIDLTGSRPPRSNRRPRAGIESQEVAPGAVLDFNDRGEVGEIEIVGLSRRELKPNLKELGFSAA